MERVQHRARLQLQPQPRNSRLVLGQRSARPCHFSLDTVSDGRLRQPERACGNKRFRSSSSVRKARQAAHGRQSRRRARHPCRQPSAATVPCSPPSAGSQLAPAKHHVSELRGAVKHRMDGTSRVVHRCAAGVAQPRELMAPHVHAAEAARPRPKEPPCSHENNH